MTRSISIRSQCDWPSKCTRVSSPRVSMKATSQLSLTAIGRLLSDCGQIGTSAIARRVGCKIGPPEASE
ncbi:hypothetical protein D3C78_1427200 [compost metagenome]